jgi:hypothetical protein
MYIKIRKGKQINSQIVKQTIDIFNQIKAEDLYKQIKQEDIEPTALSMGLLDADEEALYFDLKAFITPLSGSSLEAQKSIDRLLRERLFGKALTKLKHLFLFYLEKEIRKII